MKKAKPTSRNYKPVFAKKSFGQNFLVDDQYIEKIVAEVNPQAGETIIEIGAGRGALTGSLVKNGAQILAIELDKDLIPVLEREFSGRENFKLIAVDALKIDFGELLRQSAAPNLKAKLVANLPYYISTAILQRLIEQRECFSELVLMLQREVVERIVAPPGNSERGYLSVLVEAYFETEKLFDVSPQSFRPIPKVWSSVVFLKIKESGLITSSSEREKLLWRLVSLCFTQKRKTILNNLKKAAEQLRADVAKQISINSLLEIAEIEPQRRAETLTLAEWLRIVELFNQNS